MSPVAEESTTENTTGFSELEGLIGLDEAIEMHKEKLRVLREGVRKLTFKKIDIAGNYASIAYKAFDGGKMGVKFNPFEVNVIDVADSNGKRKVHFLVPEVAGYEDNENVLNEVLARLDMIPEVQRLVSLLKRQKVKEITYLPKDADNLMEIAEWACIFDRLAADIDDPIIILKDGLLRTKAIRSDQQNNLIIALRDIVRQRRKYVKLVGVSKTSAVVSLLSAALILEKKIPSDSIGYVKVPLDLELRAYRWTGKGPMIDLANAKPLTYAFGQLYIAKLARNSNLLVTIEIPTDLENGKPIYSDDEIDEILSYLAKDSKTSYPIVGYPQTIMRAHETAVRLGFPASLLKDELKDRILDKFDRDVRELVRDSWLLQDWVDKGNLGGGGYN